MSAKCVKGLQSEFDSGPTGTPTSLSIHFTASIKFILMMFDRRHLTEPPSGLTGVVGSNKIKKLKIKLNVLITLQMCNRRERS